MNQTSFSKIVKILCKEETQSCVGLKISLAVIVAVRKEMMLARNAASL